VSDAPAPAKPLPVPDEQSAGYWAAASEHVLAIARCGRCGMLTHPPGTVCPHCLSADPAFTFAPVDGRGTVRSWTVLRDSFLPGFAADVPFVLVDVELDAQADLRCIGRLVDGPDAALAIGDRVITVFDDLAPGVAVPAFSLAS
jgi:hypothetical protein